MEQYISLAILLAEINRLIAELVEKGENTMFEQGRISAFEDAKLFLDTLEVKEVDLEKQIEEHVINMPMSEFTHESEVEDFYEWARKEFRYFFKLGVNASNPLTWEDIADILDVTDVIANDDSMEERLKTMSEEEYCKEVLKRFKERKEEKV